MSIVYHTSPAPAAPMLPIPFGFEKRWKRIEPLIRLNFVARNDDEYVNGLLDEAHQQLWTLYNLDALMMDTSSDKEWVQLGMNAILQPDEPSLFERQFAIIEKRLAHWMRITFKEGLLDDVKQGAFIKLWKDYEKHRDHWETKPESYWVASAKLAMRWTYRELNSPITAAKGSCRRREVIERVQHTFGECDFPDFAEEPNENEENDLLDTLCQRGDVDIHGKETQIANLRLDLEMLLQLARKHYNPSVFERCLLMLERLAEGYSPTEIRLELGWTKHTLNMTAQQIRKMSQFAEGYTGKMGRANVLSDADHERIVRMRAAGCSCTEIARFIGCNPMTVFRYHHAAQAS